ncbi:MAG: hypothetical protein ABSE07_06450 [Methanoregula sp.]
MAVLRVGCDYAAGQVADSFGRPGMVGVPVGQHDTVYLGRIPAGRADIVKDEFLRNSKGGVDYDNALSVHDIDVHEPVSRGSLRGPDGMDMRRDLHTVTCTHPHTPWIKTSRYQGPPHEPRPPPAPHLTSVSPPISVY